MIITIAKFSLEQILPLLCSSKYRIELEGYAVRVNGPRFNCFKRNIICTGCQREGSYFLLQKQLLNDKNPHLNLYTADDRMMTMDHIIPRWAGGETRQFNLQTMCQPCNAAKGGVLPDGFDPEQWALDQAARRIEEFKKAGEAYRQQRMVG